MGTSTRSRSTLSRTAKSVTIPLRLTLALWLGALAIYALILPSYLQPNFVKTVAYFLAAVALFTTGYLITVARTANAPLPERNAGPVPVKLIAISAIFLIGASIVLARTIQVNQVGDVAESLNNLGQAYTNRKTLQATEGAGGRGTGLVTFLFFLYPFAIPLGIIYWQEIGTKLKALVLFAGLSYVGYFVAAGTMKGVGDMAILLAVGSLVRLGRNRRSGLQPAKPGFRKNHQLIFYSTVIAVLSGAFFVIVSAFASRANYRGASLSLFQESGPLGKLLGPYWASGVETAMLYYAKGFTGLGYALDFPASGGIYSGFRSLSYLLSKYFGFAPQYESASPFIAEAFTGYSATINWWTVLPWLASSFGWVGALIAMAVVGAFTARLWFNAMMLDDNLSVGLLAFVMTAVFFVPANNQVFLSSSSTVGVLVLLVVYALRQFGLLPGRRSVRGESIITSTTPSVRSAPAVGSLAS